MESQVRNESVGPNYSVHYTMHLEHEDKYDVTLKGNLVGALTDLNFDTAIVYKSKANRVSSIYMDQTFQATTRFHDLDIFQKAIKMV